MKIKIIVTVLSLVLVAGAGFSATQAATNSGNGADSINNAHVTKVNKTKVKQKNNAAQFNVVGVEQKAGNNKANNNTGPGDVTLASGGATAGVGVGNAANQNSAEVTPCDCVNGVDPVVSNTGNGAGSTNTATYYQKNKLKVGQTNNAVQVNVVGVSQNTGGNQANSNTGGSVDVTSGDAAATVLIENVANSNTVVIE